MIGNSHVAKGPDVHRSAEFRAGLKRLFGLGLSFDAWIFHHQLAEVTELARAFPDGNIVLCHMGGVLGYGRWAGKRTRSSRAGRRRWPSSPSARTCRSRSVG